jgi:hypothetical protein
MNRKGLTRLRRIDYACLVAPHWATGIDLLKTKRPGAYPTAPFLRPQFMADAPGALRSAVPWYGKVNPVASAALSRDLDGGGSQSTKRSLS